MAVSVVRAKAMGDGTDKHLRPFESLRLLDGVLKVLERGQGASLRILDDIHL